MDKLDPEMLKNIDLLLNMEVVEQESAWDAIEAVDETETLEVEGETAKPAAKGESK